MTRPCLTCLKRQRWERLKMQRYHSFRILFGVGDVWVREINSYGNACLHKSSVVFSFSNHVRLPSFTTLWVHPHTITSKSSNYSRNDFFPWWTKKLTNIITLNSWWGCRNNESITLKHLLLFLKRFVQKLVTCQKINWFPFLKCWIKAIMTILIRQAYSR